MTKPHLLSVLNTQLLMLPHKFGDVDGLADRAAEIERKYSLDSKTLWQSQRAIDLAKRAGMSRGQFRTLVTRYLSGLCGADGFDVYALERDMQAYKGTMERHLGREWMFLLSTLIKIHNELNQKEAGQPRGLLRAL